MTNQTLASYNTELQPRIREMLELKEVLAQWKKEDKGVLQIQDEIKVLQDSLKALVEDKKSELLRQIKDIETDVKLACKAAVKGSAYKPQELKAYLYARAADAISEEDEDKKKVAKVIGKGELFAELAKELA